ncbi:UNVERIFIED_CONTAM: hypothetical protein K2H54_038088 [Gekko kuhli]
MHSMHESVCALNKVGRFLLGPSEPIHLPMVNSDSIHIIYPLTTCRIFFLVDGMFYENEISNKKGYENVYQETAGRHFPHIGPYLLSRLTSVDLEGHNSVLDGHKPQLSDISDEQMPGRDQVNGYDPFLEQKASNRRILKGGVAPLITLQRIFAKTDRVPERCLSLFQNPL